MAGHGHGCSSRFISASWSPPLRPSNRFTLAFCRHLLLSAHSSARNSRRHRAVRPGTDRVRRSLPLQRRHQSRASLANRASRKSFLRTASTARLRLVFRSATFKCRLFMTTTVYKLQYFYFISNISLLSLTPD